MLFSRGGEKTQFALHDNGNFRRKKRIPHSFSTLLQDISVLVSNWIVVSFQRIINGTSKPSHFIQTLLCSETNIFFNEFKTMLHPNWPKSFNHVSLNTCMNWQIRDKIFVTVNRYSFNFLRGLDNGTIHFYFFFYLFLRFSLHIQKTTRAESHQTCEYFVIELNWYSQPMHLNQFWANEKSAQQCIVCIVHMNTKTSTSNWIFACFLRHFYSSDAILF